MWRVSGKEADRGRVTSDDRWSEGGFQSKRFRLPGGRILYNRICCFTHMELGHRTSKVTGVKRVSEITGNKHLKNIVGQVGNRTPARQMGGNRLAHCW